MPTDTMKVVDNRDMHNICLQDMLSAALIRGGLKLRESPFPEILGESAFAQLRSRITLRGDADLDRDQPDGRGAIVAIDCRHSTVSMRVDHPKGHSKRGGLTGQNWPPRARGAARMRFDKMLSIAQRFDDVEDFEFPDVVHADNTRRGAAEALPANRAERVDKAAAVAKVHAKRCQPGQKQVPKATVVRTERTPAARTDRALQSHRTVDRVTHILEEVVYNPGITFAELVRALDAAKSSVHGFTRGLLARGWLYQEQGRFDLGPQWVSPWRAAHPSGLVTHDLAELHKVAGVPRLGCRRPLIYIAEAGSDPSPDLTRARTSAVAC